MDLRVICISAVLSFISEIALTTSLRLNLSGDVNYTNIVSCVMALYLTLRVACESASISTQPTQSSTYGVFGMMYVVMALGMIMSHYHTQVLFSNDDFDVFVYLIIGTLTTYINHCHNHLSSFIQQRRSRSGDNILN